MKRTYWIQALALSVLATTSLMAQEEEPQKLMRFDPWVQMTNAEGGIVTITREGKSTSECAVNQKAYPYGSTIEVAAEAKARFYFDSSSYIIVTGPAIFTPMITAKSPIADTDCGRIEGVTIDIKYGTYQFAMSGQVQDGQFAAKTFLGTISSIKGRSKLKVGDISKHQMTTEDFKFVVNSGSAKFQGTQFNVTLDKATAFSAGNSPYMLETVAQGKNGRMNVELPAKGTVSNEDAELSSKRAATSPISDAPVPFILAENGVITILRAKAAGSDNWIVSVSVCTGAGRQTNYFSYVENRSREFCTGERVYQEGDKQGQLRTAWYWDEDDEEGAKPAADEDATSAVVEDMDIEEGEEF